MSNKVTYFLHFLCISLRYHEVAGMENQTKCKSSSEFDMELIDFLTKNYINPIDSQLPTTEIRIRRKVGVEIHIQQIVSLSAESTDFVIDLFFSEIWHDTNLNFKKLNLNLCKTNLTLGSDFEERIWGPKISIANSKSSYTHKSPSSNDFLILYEDGTVWRNYRMRISAPCQFNLSFYPFDKVECELVFQSFEFETNEVTVDWQPANPVTLMSYVNLPDFDLVDYHLYKSIADYRLCHWDQAKIQFLFSRKIGYHLLQTYLPSGLTVACSWMTFFFDHAYTSARVTVGVSALLALSFQFVCADDLPRVSELTGADVWMLICISFIFMSLAEFAVVSRLRRMEKRRSLQQICIVAMMSSTKSRTPRGQTRQQIETNIDWKTKIRKFFKLNVDEIDKLSICLFPSLFLLCNLVYWSCYYL